MGNITPSTIHVNPVGTKNRTRRRRKIISRRGVVLTILTTATIALLQQQQRRNILFFGVVEASSAAGQETLIGIVGKDFVLLGADSSLSQSIAVTASNLDKIAVISDPFPFSHSPPTTTSSLTGTTSAISLHQQQQQRHSIFRQYAILAAAAGNAAEADRLIGLLKALASIQEYENGFGCDVDIIDCSSRSSNNNNKKPEQQRDEPGSMRSETNYKQDNDNSHPLHPSRFFKMWTKSSTTAISTATSTARRPNDGMTPNNNDDGVTRTSDETNTFDSFQQSPLPPISPPGLTVESVAHMARGQIANALRSRTPFRVCLLVAGLQPVVINKSTSSIPQQRQQQEQLSQLKEQQQQQLDGQDNEKEQEYMSLTLQRQVRSSWLSPSSLPSLPALLSPPPPSTLLSTTLSTPNDEPSTETITEPGNEESSVSSSSSVVLTMTDQEQQQHEQQQQHPETTTAHNNEPVHHVLEPRLYWLDEYGSIQQLPYGAHGLGSHFVWSILDDGYRPDMTRSEAIMLLKSCFEQLRQRYIINAQAQTPPCIKCLDVNGWQLIR